jgi:hypothetical protein
MAGINTGFASLAMVVPASSHVDLDSLLIRRRLD